MKGQTLYVQKNMTEGFFVDEDAKVVFVQTNSGKTTTELATGSDEVHHFIDDLNKKDNAKYSFVISAILENGAAIECHRIGGIDGLIRQKPEKAVAEDQHRFRLFGKGDAIGVVLTVFAVAGVALGLYGAVSRPCQRRLQRRHLVGVGFQRRVDGGVVAIEVLHHDAVRLFPLGQLKIGCFVHR